ncbi:SusC/RagA family TonB-linked outer membrane protein [Echinicola pacifica]|uniref:SusC/RagA family TonB-linked outer membrane protein n=2 Tax=Echinicola pacifica TaxID=346377 RepID=A0A918PXU0_9BACT|nr:SusC/RagA family TonB-linked outer membrane protein [Echinicola pacifica]
MAMVSYGQKITITGQVTSAADGQTLPIVNVLEKGSTNGTVTDMDGSYSIQVSGAQAVLVYSSIGYLAKEVPVGNQTAINVTLEEDVKSLDEVVVIGYGSQKKSDLTGSVGTVSSEEINKYTNADATQAIQGRVPGVRVDANGGAPGANSIVTIRGAGTLSDSGPLYVIDGMLTNSMNMLNPADIESISVLKDASASAIYGSRAANGVIIVTTKKGKKGEIKVDTDFSYGWQKATNTIDWATATQYAAIRNQANDNDGTPRAAANDSQFNPNINSDIQAASLRVAPIFNGNVRISGGGDNATFSISANHLDQVGIIQESDYTRTNIRANSTFTKGKFKLEETIGLTRTVNNPNNYFNQERDLLPTIPIYDENGNFTASSMPDGSTTIYGVGNITNSLGLASVEDRTVTRNSVLGNIAASYEIIEGLTYKLNLGLDQYSQNNYTFTPTFFFNATLLGRQDFAELRETNTNYLSALAENTLNFSRVFGDHSLNVLAGYTSQKTHSRSLGIVATGFPNNEVRVASAAENRAQAPSRDITTGLRSYFGRINYNYKSRYLLTTTIRRDGSSLFREGLRWGTFPSVALGWNISEEAFMEKITFLSDLKLRASYGELGSNNVDAYAIDPEMNLFSEAILGEGQVRVPGTSITKPVNRDIRWETTKTTDIGLEFSMLDNSLQFTMDYFVKKSEDILLSITVPRYTGMDGRVPSNVATIENRGFEFSTNYNRTIGEVNLNLAANFTVLENEVTAIGIPDPIYGGGYSSNGLSATLTDVGQPVASFFGYKVLGIYQSDDEALQDGRTDGAKAGDLKFQDSNGDGQLTEDDRVYLGSSIPDFEYGFNVNATWKNFDMSMFFNGVSGNKILNGNLYRGYFDTEGNYLADAMNAWTPDNTDTDVPRMTLLDFGYNRRMSDYVLESGSYFRLRNLQIGYTLPDALTEKLQINRLRLYTSLQNVFTLTKYTGYYPVVGRGSRDRGSDQDIFNQGVDESAYPTPRTYQIGLQISF